MTKYILTSPKFNGDIVFGYQNGHIVLYHNECDNEAAIIWLKTFLPVNESDIPALQKKIDGQITVIPEDISFDRFWELYDKKINRKRAEPLYKKLNDPNKLKAILGIKSYHHYCNQTGRGIADPENYLRNELYLTDWKTLRK